MGTVTTATEKLTVLVLGCGRQKAFDTYALKDPQGRPFTRDEVDFYTLDVDATVDPTFVCHLGREPIPLPDNSVHLAGAWHVLEHIGRQGELEEWQFFWSDLYRVLRPGGRLQFESPLASSLWAWADPTHSRAINEWVFLYLNQDAYRAQPSAIPTYRFQCDFVVDGPWERRADTTNPDVMALEPVSHLRGTLKARKPFRPWWEDGSS